MPTLVQRLQRRVVQDSGRARTRSLRTPSFTYKVLEMRRIREGMRDLGVRDPVYLINAKDDAHAWARRLGIRTPRLIAVLPSVDDIAWDGVGHELVLKPVHGTSSTGVYLLRREHEERRWRELDSGRVLTAQDVVAEYRALAERGLVSAEVVLEELIVDPRCPEMPPTDYKVMTFYGVVGLIEAKRRCHHGRTGRACWKIFDADWISLRNPFNDYLTDESIEPPVEAEALLDLARRISLAVPRPFLRVDLYEDALGPVFGEVTPLPGGEYVVRSDVDRRLGLLWEEAETRLRGRLARDGVLTPEGLTPEPADLEARPRRQRTTSRQRTTI